MKPTVLMLLGALAFLVTILVTHSTEAAVMIFTAGAVFGLGYGAHEQKSKLDSLRADLFAKEVEAVGYLRAVGMLQARPAEADTSTKPEEGE